MQPKIPCACQKHDSPMDRRLSMNNRTIAIPFEPGLKGVSQENPTSFLWKNYTCWAWFGFCYLHFNISCGEVTYVAMATGNWNFPWFWSRTWQNMCYKTKKIILMEFYDLCHSQWLCIAYRTHFLWAESCC